MACKAAARDDDSEQAAVAAVAAKATFGNTVGNCVAGRGRSGVNSIQGGLYACFTPGLHQAAVAAAPPKLWQLCRRSLESHTGS